MDDQQMIQCIRQRHLFPLNRGRKRSFQFPNSKYCFLLPETVISNVNIKFSVVTKFLRMQTNSQSKDATLATNYRIQKFATHTLTHAQVCIDVNG